MGHAVHATTVHSVVSFCIGYFEVQVSEMHLFLPCIDIFHLLGTLFIATYVLFFFLVVTSYLISSSLVMKLAAHVCADLHISFLVHLRGMVRS